MNKLNSGPSQRVVTQWINDDMSAFVFFPFGRIQEGKAGVSNPKSLQIKEIIGEWNLKIICF